MCTDDEPCPKAQRVISMLESSEQTVEQLKSLIETYKRQQQDLAQCIEQQEQQGDETDEKIRVIEREREKSTEEVAHLQEQLDRCTKLLQRDEMQKEHKKEVSGLKRQLSERVQEIGQLKTQLHQVQREVELLREEQENTPNTQQPIPTAPQPQLCTECNKKIQNNQNTNTNTRGGPPRSKHTTQGGLTPGGTSCLEGDVVLPGTTKSVTKFLRPNLDACSVASVDHLHSMVMELHDALDEQIELVNQRTAELESVRSEHDKERKKWKLLSDSSLNCSDATELANRKAQLQEREHSLAKAASLIGDTLVRNGKLEEAVRLYTTAVELNPNMKACVGNRAYVHLQLGRHDECLYDCEKYLTTAGPQDAEIFYYRAQCYHQLRRYNEALEDLQTGMGMKPKPEMQALAKEIKHKLRRRRSRSRDHASAPVET